MAAMPGWHTHAFPLLKLLADTPFLVLAGRPALLLSKGSQEASASARRQSSWYGCSLSQNKYQCQGISSSRAVFFQNGKGIAGKPGHGFGNDHVNLPGPAVREQLLELWPVIPGAGHGLIGINP